MSGMASDDAPAQVSVEGDVSDKKVEVQDQNEVSGMPSRQEEEAVIKKKFMADALLVPVTKVPNAEPSGDDYGYNREWRLFLYHRRSFTATPKCDPIDDQTSWETISGSGNI